MSRVVIWTIVAIVVVLGVIFIVSTRRQAAALKVTKPLSDEAYERYVNRMERQIDQFNRRIERIKRKYGSASEVASSIQVLDAEMEEFIKSVEDLKGKKTREEREEGYNNTQEHIRKIRRLIRDLGGTTESD